MHSTLTLQEGQCGAGIKQRGLAHFCAAARWRLLTLLNSPNQLVAIFQMQLDPELGGYSTFT